MLDGGAEFEVMSVADVEAIRTRSRAKSDDPWVTDWEVMARKTAVRQLAKWLPMASVLNRAIAAKGQVRTDLDPRRARHLRHRRGRRAVDEPTEEPNNDAAGTEDVAPPAEEDSGA